MTWETEAFRLLLRGMMSPQGMSLRALARQIPVDPGQLSRVVHGKRRPSPEFARRCDEILGAGGRLVQAATDAAPAPLMPLDHDSAGRGLLDPLDALCQVRSELDEALASATVTAGQLELIEASTFEHVQAYPHTAPAVVLSRLAGECREVERLSRRRQPASVQARLSGAAALLATMCADALMRLGALVQARLWYRTAVVAADDSGEQYLRVLVRAQAAMLPYYYGDPHQSVMLSQAALELSTTPSSATVLAVAARARSLARLNAAASARADMDEARRLFDQLGDADTDAAFRFPAKRLQFYLSGAATWLGDTDSAYRIQDEALTLYRSSPVSVIDPTLINLDRAMCLVKDRRASEAVAVTQEAIAALPEIQRTEIVLSRVVDMVDVVPPTQRGGEVIALADYVSACRARARTQVDGSSALVM